MNETLSLEALAQLVEGELVGDASLQISGVAPLSSAQSGQVSWLASEAYLGELDKTQASAVLITPQLPRRFGNLVICERPDLAVAKLIAHFNMIPARLASGIDSRAAIGRNVTIGANVSIGPWAVIQDGVTIGENTIVHSGVFIGEKSSIGADCLFWPHVVVRERVKIGSRVIIHAHAAIGCDGFGFNRVDGKFQRFPHIGSVTIEDDVEIGAGTCIDRGKFSDTQIGRGTKIDNLVQVAHNVKVGADCCIVAQAGIAGSATLDDNVILGGKAGVRDHVHIGRGGEVAAYSGLAEDVPAGTSMLGTPAQPRRFYMEQYAATKRLPELVRQIRELQVRVAELEANTIALDNNVVKETEYLKQ